ncbi:MAG: DUF4180 domain-containing protein [Ruthenibacterium lactatiformans]
MPGPYCKIHQLRRKAGGVRRLFRYTSKPLRDFIRESNRGRDIFFPATRQEAILRLAGV